MNSAFLGVAFALVSTIAAADVGGDGPSAPRAAGSSSVAAPQRVIKFARRTWHVKSAPASKVGPGPNFYDDSERAVWVDARGRLHLRVAQQDGKWQGAEVTLDEPLGRGSYRFMVESDLSQLDPNIVVGMFIWDDAAAQSHREIDIEIGRWGNMNDAANAQFVVQPFRTPGNSLRWTTAWSDTTYTFRWLADRVEFDARHGRLGQRWTWEPTAPVPDAGDARVHINLWMLKGMSPANQQPVEVVLTDFEFTPAQSEQPGR